MLVRQSAKRERIPDVLELAEIQLLLSKLGVRERTLVFVGRRHRASCQRVSGVTLAGCGLRQSATQPTRSIWHQVVGDCKTASAKPVPLDSYMAEDLLRWRRQSAYAQDEHYVFASETMKGEQPY